MKVAVTAAGEGLESPVDQRFGRAAAMVIVDSENMRPLEHIDNSENAAAAGGAGISAAQAVVSKGVKAVLTGRVGPNAFRALSQAGVSVYCGAAGTVRDSVEAFLAGKLARSDEATASPGGAGGAT